MSVSVVDFFSGCGGTSVGFRAAGAKIIGAIDFDFDSTESFRANFPGATIFQRDIRELSVDEVKSIVPPGPLLFAGCAPCQPFSAQNRSQSALDPRRALLNEFLRFVRAIRPEYVVVENVPGLQRASSDGPLARFVRSVRRIGYTTSVEVLRALDYGVPQERKRLVLIASRVGRPALPSPRGGAPSTVREWISELPRLGPGDVDQFDPDHASMSLSPLNLQRIRATPEGGGRRDWPRRLVADCHKDYAGHSDVYGRMWWDRPASGLTTRCISYSNGRFGHPEQDRAISLREAALLQTFPVDFRFSGTLTSKARQVGHAVPPLMAQRILESLGI